MAKYLLSTYAVEDGSPSGPPPEPEVMEEMMTKVVALEADLDAAGAFTFGGHLADRDAATVVDATGGEVVMTDGPFVESKEHIAGFYIVDADDLDAALGWAERVSDCVGRPIEVHPFAASGRAADHMDG